MPTLAFLMDLCTTDVSPCEKPLPPRSFNASSMLMSALTPVPTPVRTTEGIHGDHNDEGVGKEGLDVTIIVQIPYERYCIEAPIVGERRQRQHQEPRVPCMDVRVVQGPQLHTRLVRDVVLKNLPLAERSFPVQI